MKGIEKAAVMPNLTKDGAYETSLRVIEVLSELGIGISMNKKLCGKYKNLKIDFFATDDEMISACDMVLTIGGDGTIIHAARHAAPLKKPLLGINMGRLGFAAELEPNELHMLERLKNGNFQVDRRMMLEIEHTNINGTNHFYAVNDAVISRGSLSRLIDIDVSLEKGYMCNYRADGLIISTPTGSSAYSLAAGGPVVEPTMKCIVMTPICSHSLFGRSVVFSHSSKLAVTASCDDNTEVFLTVDGAKTVIIRKTDIVNITSADIETDFITLKDKNFYRVLNDKFTERRK